MDDNSTVRGIMERSVIASISCEISLQLSEEQAVPGKLERHTGEHVFAILTTYKETRL